MGMSTYPVVVEGAFLITDELAKKVASQIEFEVDGNDIPVLEILQETGIEYIFHSEFTGEAEALVPEKVIGSGEAIEFYDQPLCYLFPKKGISLFKKAYDTPEEIIAEYQGLFSDAGIDLPDFDWYAHLVNICGVYSC